MSHRLLTSLLFIVCLMGLIAPGFAAPPPAAHAPKREVTCPMKMAPLLMKPEDIPLLSGHVNLPEYHASADLPSNMRFISTADARAYMHDYQEWTVCSANTLAGFIVSPQRWRDSPDPDVHDHWMIQVYYDPEYVSNEDVLVTDYDEIAMQVRESFYDREQADYEFGGVGRAQHVMGWAVVPDYDVKKDSVLWSLHIVEGNDPDYTVPYNMLKMGRHGAFLLYMNGKMAQNKENAELLRQAANSLHFDKGWTYTERSPQTDSGKTTTIGTVIAESVDTDRATPLTWADYFRVLKNALQKLFLHYAVEIGVGVTLLIVFGIFAFIRHQWRMRNGYYAAYPDDEPDWDDEDFEREYRRRAAMAARLNGAPIEPSG